MKIIEVRLTDKEEAAVERTRSQLAESRGVSPDKVSFAEALRTQLMAHQD